jgi:hypothetical protein
LLLALGSACQAVVLEPVDESTYYGGNIRFWGYSPSPGETVSIQAQNTSAGWETLTTTTSSLVPTHTAGSTGYMFEGWYYGPNIPTRFRFASQFGSPWWRTNFRVVTSSTNSIAQIRQYQANGTNSTSQSWFEEYWYEHKAAGTTIRVDVRP